MADVVVVLACPIPSMAPGDRGYIIGEAADDTVVPGYPV